MVRTPSPGKKYSTMNSTIRRLQPVMRTLEIAALVLLLIGASYARAENPRLPTRAPCGLCGALS